MVIQVIGVQPSQSARSTSSTHAENLQLYVF